jgi:hypothetical protein
MEALMRSSFKLIPALLVALLLMLAVACKGGGGDDSSSNQQPDGEEEYVLSAAETLGQSADDFQAEVQSLQGEMAVSMKFGEFDVGMEGDFAFQSPDRMHMTMSFSGGDDSLIDLSEMGDMEMLLIGEEIYVQMPFVGGWVKASLDDLGLDSEEFRELLSGQAPFDYAQMISDLGDDVNVQDLGVEEIEGKSYQHYRFSSDFATLMESLSSTYGEDFSGYGMDDISGPIVMDLWLDTTTLLPYKMTAKGVFNSPDPELGGNAEFAMSFVINEYNGDVQFPEPPADAIDFSEMGEEMFEGMDEGLEDLDVTFDEVNEELSEGMDSE